MVEGSLVVVLGELLPALIEVIPRRPELTVLLHQPLVYDGDGLGRVLLQQVQDLLAMVTINAADGVGMDNGEGTGVVLVLIPGPTDAGVFWKVRGRRAKVLRHDLGGGEERNLLHERLQDTDGGCVGVQDHVDLESLARTEEERGVQEV